MNNEQLRTQILTYRPTVTTAPHAATYSLFPVTYSLIYSFSAKERDAETGLSVTSLRSVSSSSLNQTRTSSVWYSLVRRFGARYYSSDLSVWLSVDPMSGEYPSLSPYVYCADNPVRCVDPNGEDLVVADNVESHNDILSIVKECYRNRVTFGEDGKISVNKEGMKTEDAGLDLLSKMANSDKKYYFETSNIALYRDENGERNYENLLYNIGCINASNGGLDSKGKHTYCPIEGFDGQVVISKTGVFFNGLRFPDRRKNVVFHELAENYFRTDCGLNFWGTGIFGNIRKGGAHQCAANMEFQAWNTWEAGANYYAPPTNKNLNYSDVQRALNYVEYGIY